MLLYLICMYPNVKDLLSDTPSTTTPHVNQHQHNDNTERMEGPKI